MEKRIGKYLPKKNQWMILLLIGVLFVVIAIPTGSSSESDSDIFTKQKSLSTNTEERLISMLEQMKGVGQVDVMITDEGILIIAEGGGNAIVAQEITGVVKALFHVDSHKIKVIERK